MKTLNWSGVTNWTPDMIQAYHAEQQSLLMQRQVEILGRLDRMISNLWEQEVQRGNVVRTALELMTNREPVRLCFDGAARVRFTQLQGRLQSRGIRALGSELREAIPLTDYLVLTPAGSGWRVWLAEDYEQARGGAHAI